MLRYFAHMYQIKCSLLSNSQKGFKKIINGTFDFLKINFEFQIYQR